MNDKLDKLFRAAMAADQAYTCELVRVYGRHACEARYHAHHNDARVMKAANEKVAADKAWLDALRQAVMS